MSENIFKIRSSALPDDVQVAAFKGHEAISEPYAFEIGLLTSDKGWNHDDAVMAKATLQIGGDDAPYLHSGIFAAVELIHEFGGRMLYRAVLVPKLWQLTLTRHSNVWTDKSIPDVIKDVLKWSGIKTNEYELRLQGNYPVKEYIAQYKEDNLSFISRWMERLGIFYFFEQGDDAEKLVLVDTQSFDGGTPNPKVRYVPATQDDQMVLDAFWVFRSRTNALPASMELLDYDYLNPRLDVRATKPVLSTGLGEISRFGDDNFLTPGDGGKLAQVRSEELLVTRKQMHAQGRVLHLFAGWPFTLEDHPRADLSDKKYLVTAIEHEGTQAAAGSFAREMLGLHHNRPYFCEVTAIPATVQFRARSVHPWPRVDGYESGTVDGPSDSQYAQIDAHGRYKVRIMFDESDLGGGKASPWVRMQQPYGGSPEGFHFPLIKGTEVLLWFMGGDPDRPVIAGVAPTSLTPSPVINNNNTTNIIQTINLNVFEMVDIDNEMTIRISCPISNTYIKMGFDAEFQFILNCDANVHFDIGGLFKIDVDLTMTVNVELDVNFHFNANFIVYVKVDNNITIDGSLNLVVAVDVNWNISGNWIVLIAGFATLTIDGNLNLTVDGDVNIVIDGDLNLQVGGDVNVQIGGDLNVKIGGDENITIGGDQNITIGGKQNINVLSDWKWNVLGHDISLKMANSTSITIGLTNDIYIGIKNSIFIGGQINLTLAATLDLKAAASVALTLGAFMNIKGSMELNMTAAAIIAIDAGLRLNITAGASISIFAGIKLNLEAGIELKLIGGPQLEIVPIKLVI
jgi:type VI secretion system secreted protein VgrG